MRLQINKILIECFGYEVGSILSLHIATMEDLLYMYMYLVLNSV